MINPARFTYFQASGDGFRTKSNRIEFDWLDNRTHSKIDVRLPNPIERLVLD